MANEQPLDTVSQQVILAACHHVAQTVGWTVKQHYWADVAQNFHWVQFTKYADEVSVFFHAHFPFIAFSSSTPKGLSGISFIDCDDLSAGFSEHSDFEVIPIDELRRQATQQDLASLSKADRKQAYYWRPATIGEIIFNFWD